MSEKLTKDEVAQFEAKVDAHFLEVPLPSRDYQQALWHLLTVAEDSPRIFMLGRSQRKDMNELEVLHQALLFTNQVKYGLRHGMDRLRKEIPFSTMRVKTPRLENDVAMLASQLLHAGMDYDVAFRAFTGFWNNRFTSSFDPTVAVISFHPVASEVEAFQALYVLLGAEQQGVTSIFLYLVWSGTHPSKLPEVVRDIFVRAVPIGRDRIGYQYDQNLALKLADYLATHPGPELRLPKDWSFPWGSRDDVLKVFKALELRALYHLISVHFGAINREVRGYGVQSLLLTIKREQLIRELTELQSVPREVVGAVLEALTYAHLTTSPDPALQPLIDAGEGWLHVPVTQVVSSNYGRNLLVLQNRIDRTGFDNQSKAFEREMILVCEAELNERFTYWRPNSFVPGFPKEIDLLIADEKSHVLLVGEAKWMIEPGDSREISDRQKEFAVKIQQAKDRVTHISQNLQKTLVSLGVPAQYRKDALWSVRGIVIVDGYTGTAMGLQFGIPAVPMEVFLIGLRESKSLRKLCTVLESGDWLPKRDLHFLSGTQELDFGEVRLQWPSFAFPLTHRYRDFLTEAFDYSPSDL